MKKRMDRFWADVERIIGRQPLAPTRTLKETEEAIKSMHRSIENQAAEDSHWLDQIAKKHGIRK